MEGVREYLLSVTAGAMVCALLTGLMGQKGSVSGLHRLICGLFLCFTVMAPIVKVKINDFSNLAEDLFSQGQQYVQDGLESTRDALRQIIIDEARSYIMDKAQSYGAEVTVQITLSDSEPPVPVSCQIQGAVSPYVRQQLTLAVEAELGIPEENLTWNQ